MKYYIFDMEADDLLPGVSKIHCLSFIQLGVSGAKVRTITRYDQMLRFFQQKGVVFIGHNIWDYDIPAAEKVLGFEFDAKSNRVVDTLALSWYLFEDRLKHGLEEWGKDLGVKKVEVTDWKEGDLELYIHRCEEDVKINKILLDTLNRKLIALYGDSDKRSEVADYVSFKMYCYYLAKKNKLRLDMDLVDSTLYRIEQKLEETKSALEAEMPKVPIYKKKNRPKIMYKKDGSLSTHGENWLEILGQLDLPEDHPGPVKYIVGYEEPNYKSGKQIKGWLFSLGWEPTVFKDGAEGRDTVPQVRVEDEDGAKVLAPCVKKLAGATPAIQYLEELGVLVHRKGLLDGFVANVDETGHIAAEINGLTKTLRVKHKTLVNLPKPAKAWGAEIRGCLCAPEGYELAGSDVSGLEDTTKRHYIFPYDPEYVREQMDPAYDPHCDIAMRAGLMTEEDVAFFKAYKRMSGAIEKGNQPAQEDIDTVKSFELADKAELKKFEKLGADRSMGKITNFSSTYKCGPPKLAKTIGCSVKKAKTIHAAFWRRNWAILEFEKSLKTKKLESPYKVTEEQWEEVKQPDGSYKKTKKKVSYFVNKIETWVLNPMNGFWYILRAEKDKFSAINQSTGAFCFDMWLKNILEVYPRVAAQFHDELVAIIPLGVRDRFSNFLTEQMNKVNEQYKLNTPLRVDVEFGDNYAQVH